MSPSSPRGPGGGNPAPIVVDAAAMSGADMRPSRGGTGAVWLLDRLGKLPADTLSLWTRSGVVDARLTEARGARTVEVNQPRGTVEPVPEQAIAPLLDVLGITSAELAPLPVQNARTSRTKTLVPLADVTVLDGLCPDFDRMEQVCDLLASTGRYPYAAADPAGQVYDARQFSPFFWLPGGMPPPGSRPRPCPPACWRTGSSRRPTDPGAAGAGDG